MKSLNPLSSFFPKASPSMAISATTFRSPMFCISPSSQNGNQTTLIRPPSKSCKSFSASPTSIAATPSSPSKKVLVPIGFGTEEMEAVIMVDVLRRAGAEVIIASVEQQLEVKASAGTKLVADTLISACSDQIFDLVALPGGMPGAARLRDCEALQKITLKQVEEERLYGAISAAPAVTLLPWGLLKRKQATCHPAFIHKLPTFWAVKSNLQVSRGLTTSRGPGTSFEFAISLVEQLFGESVAAQTAELLLIKVEDGMPSKLEFNEVQWSFNGAPKVLIPIANGSEEIEVVTTVDILRRAKADVVVASVEKSLHILSSSGVKIVADKLISAVTDSSFDLVILLGGLDGAGRLHRSRTLKKLLKEHELAGKIIGAICSSPAILQKQGLLKDKKVTSHPSVLSKLSHGMDHAQVVIDGKVITSRGLATVIEFALSIVSKLFGHARARSVAEGLVYEYPRR